MVNNRSVRILVVENDEFFRKLVSEALKSKGYLVTDASSGKAAVEILSLQKIDIVISDIQMPGMSGLELLEWSVVKNPVPFVIMTGFSTIFETHSAFELGAKEFITKPFNINDLDRIIKKILGLETAPAQIKLSKQYGKVSLGSFLFEKKLEFNIYIKLSDYKYVKIANLGDELGSDRIVSYQEKGLKHLYVIKDDFDKIIKIYLGAVKKNKSENVKNTNKGLKEILDLGEMISEKILIDGLNEELSIQLKSFVDMLLDIPAGLNSKRDLIKSMLDNSTAGSSHSVNVACLCVLVAMKLGFESRRALAILATSAMLHDIGKTKVDDRILKKSRSQLTSKEAEILKYHPVHGKDLSIAVKGIMGEVSQMILEHHEDIMGQGYPSGSKESTHHPLSKIIQLVNIFTELVFPDDSTAPKSFDEAFRIIEFSYDGRFDNKVFNALKEVVNHVLK